MSGMAILLLCTLQVDNSGWRTSQPQVGAPASTVGVPTPGASGSWGDMNELVDRAQRALQDGMNSAEEYVRQQTNAGTYPAGSAGLPNTVGGTVNWTEVEQALGQPASPQMRSTAADADTLRARIRLAEDVATFPPQPPATGPSVADRYGLPPTGAEATNYPPGGIATGFPSSDDALRVGQTFPRPPSDMYPGTGTPPPASGSEMRVGQPAPNPGLNPPQSSVPSGGREVMYEGQLDPNQRPGQRYINPPPRVVQNQPLPNQPLANQPLANQPTVGGQIPQGRGGLGTASLPTTEDPGLPRGQVGGMLNLPNPPGTTDTAGTTTSAAPDAGKKASDRPWGPFLLTVLGLFGSLGFNLYLGWIAWDLYSRYQDAVDEVQDMEAKLEAKQQELAVSHSPRSPSRHSAMVSG